VTLSVRTAVILAHRLHAKVARRTDRQRATGCDAKRGQQEGQEAQLSQSRRAMLRVIEYLAK